MKFEGTISESGTIQWYKIPAITHISVSSTICKTWPLSNEFCVIWSWNTQGTLGNAPPQKHGWNVRDLVIGLIPPTGFCPLHPMFPYVINYLKLRCNKYIRQNLTEISQPLCPIIHYKPLSYCKTFLDLGVFQLFTPMVFYILQGLELQQNVKQDFFLAGPQIFQVSTFCKEGYMSQSLKFLGGFKILSRSWPLVFSQLYTSPIISIYLFNLNRDSF